MDYLDVSFLMGDKFEECLKAVEDTEDWLSILGFQRNLKKSVFIPAQWIEYLGYILNFNGKTLANGKQQKLASFTKETLISNN